MAHGSHREATWIHIQTVWQYTRFAGLKVSGVSGFTVQCDLFMTASGANIPNPRPGTPWRQQSSGCQSRQAFDLITCVLVYTSTKAQDQIGLEVQDLLHTWSKQYRNFLNYISMNTILQKTNSNVTKKYFLDMNHGNAIVYFEVIPQYFEKSSKKSGFIILIFISFSHGQ